jgi:hypothetical protein
MLEWSALTELNYLKEEIEHFSKDKQLFEVCIVHKVTLKPL